MAIQVEISFSPVNMVVTVTPRGSGAEILSCLVGLPKGWLACRFGSTKQVLAAGHTLEGVGVGVRIDPVRVGLRCLWTMSTTSAADTFMFGGTSISGIGCTPSHYWGIP